jgi:hypothetical protein
MYSILDTTLCNKVCQLLAAGRMFSPGSPDFSTNRTDRYNINEILLKVALDTITITNSPTFISTSAYLVFLTVFIFYLFID